MESLVSHRRRLWLYFLAAAIVLFLIVPVFIVVPMSFSGSRFLDFPPATWSLRWYDRFFGDIAWNSSLIVSLKVAVATALTATPLGVAAAYAIHMGEHRIFRRLHIFLLLPLMVPHIIVAVAVFYAYARINWLGTFGGLLLAHSMLALPFVVVTTLSGLRSFDPTQEHAARSLGCSRLEAFFRVTLPQIRGSVYAGLIFAFVTSLDEVVISLFNSAGQNTTVTKVMFSSLRDEIDPTTAAVSSLLIAGSKICLGYVSASNRLSSRCNAPASPLSPSFSLAYSCIVSSIQKRGSPSPPCRPSLCFNRLGLISSESFHKSSV